MSDTGTESPESRQAEPGRRDFGRRGWVLLGMIALAFVVAPLLIYVRPPAVPFVVAYLILPLLPAFLLAIIAVWATT